MLFPEKVSPRSVEVVFIDDMPEHHVALFESYALEQRVVVQRTVSGSRYYPMWLYDMFYEHMKSLFTEFFVKP